MPSRDVWCQFDWRRSISLASLALLLSLSLGGCTIGWTDHSGQIHRFGLMHTVEPAKDDAAAGLYSSITVIGAGIYPTSAGTMAVLGYGKDRSVQMKNDAAAWIEDHE